MISTYPYVVLRIWVAVGLAVVVLVAAVSILPRSVAETSAAGRGDPMRFELPPPTGPEAIGVVDLHLVDSDRLDPLDERGGSRELMISIWYPAVRDPDAPPAPYLPRGIASFFDQTSAELGIVKNAVDFVGAVSHAQTRVRVAGGRRPTVLYAPGGGNFPRALGTTLVEELASQGYVVVTVDSTYQTPVEFPDGMRMPARNIDLKLALTERVRDLRFVIDQLELIANGGNPDVQRRSLPDRLGGVLDLDRIGLFAHSLGGFAAAEAMQVEPRIDAGVNLDGSMGAEYRSDPDGTVDRPFLLVGGGTDGSSNRPHHHLGAPDWAAYWPSLTGWKRDLYLADAEHLSFTDLQSILPAIDAELPLDSAAVAAGIGTIDPVSSLATQRAYLLAFFDQHLRGMAQPILDTVPADDGTAELVR